MPERLSISDYYDYVALAGRTDDKLELINGEIVPVSPSFLPSHIAGLILTHLNIYLMQNPMGYATGADGGYAISEGNKFNPDVGFILKTRLPEIPKGEAPVPPDFAVEVVSPSDLEKREERIERKLRAYQAIELPLLWYVYPDREQVEVYQHGEHARTAGVDDTLDGGDMLPGFSLKLADVFKL